MSARAVVLLPVALLLLVAPAGAGAAPGWVAPPASLATAGGGIPTPQVASNARGDTAVAWLDAATQTVFVSERPARAPFTVGSAVAATPDQVLGSVDIDAAGNIYVFFATNQSTPASSRTNVAIKAIGAATWSVTPLAAANSLDPPQAPVLGAVTPDGKALAVWFQGHTNNATLSNWQFATKPAGSSTWSAKALIPGSTGNAPSSSHLVMNAAGQAAFVYASQGCSGFSARAVGATMSAANVWTTVNGMETCAAGGVGLAGGPVVDIDAVGTATAAWSRSNATNNIVQFSTKTIEAASWPLTPASPTANDLSATGADANTPTIAISPDGTSTIAWIRNNAIEERTRSALGGAFAAATAIPNGLTSPTAPVLAAAGDGSVVALWSGLNATAKNVIAGARRGPGGTTFAGLPEAPGVDNSSPALAMDEEGNAPAAWAHMSSGPQYAVQASGLDVAGPEAIVTTFPSAAATGVAFAYGAGLADRWSFPTGTWTFGDGTSGPLDGQKSYAAPGSYVATLTMTDAFGNSRAVTFPITVTGAGALIVPGGAGTPDTIAPVLSAAKLTNTTFAVDAKGAAETLVTAKKAKKGTTFRFTLSEAARVLFKIEQKAKGRKVGRTCRKPARSNRSRKACTRLVAIGTFGQDAAAGGNARKFSGRLGKKSLKPGSYRATLSARDAAGNVSAVRRLSFRVVAR